MNKSVWLLSFILLVPVCLYARRFPVGPVQPAFGPGGTEYQHAGFSSWQNGVSEEQYIVFEPDRPAANKPGLVVFLHDWLTSDPGYYMAWIRHLCRKGWVVLFPKYQGSSESEKTWLFHIARSVKDYLLENFRRNRVDLDKEKFAIIGHGAGAVLGANLAAVDSYFRLPRCKALFILMPHRKNLKIYNLSAISHDASMIIITGDRIDKVNEYTAREIFYSADRVKTDNKIYITVLSDYYGYPPMIADELAPLAPELPQFESWVIKNRYDYPQLVKDKFLANKLRAKPLDAFDWYVSFRLFDALAQKVFTPKCDFNPLKDSNELRFTGYWSDGRRLKGLVASNRP